MIFDRQRDRELKIEIREREIEGASKQANAREGKVRKGSAEQEGIELRRVALPGPILISITVRGAEKERFSLITAQRYEQLADVRGFQGHPQGYEP